MDYGEIQLYFLRNSRIDTWVMTSCIWEREDSNFTTSKIDHATLIYIWVASLCRDAIILQTNKEYISRFKNYDPNQSENVDDCCPPF